MISSMVFKAVEAGDITVNLKIQNSNDLAESVSISVSIKPVTDSITYNESDIAEIIRLSLAIALMDKEIPDYALIKDKENIVLCTKNIDRDWVPKIDGVNLILLDLDEIQSKADLEGDFLYLRFTKFEIHDERSAVVNLDNMWMRRKGSPYMYLSGGGINISFIKESGTWIGKVLMRWIS